VRQKHFTHDEQRTPLTFWPIIRSPPRKGGDLSIPIMLTSAGARLGGFAYPFKGTILFSAVFKNAEPTRAKLQK
jgi:hypothetical protein